MVVEPRKRLGSDRESAPPTPSAEPKRHRRSSSPPFSVFGPAKRTSTPPFSTHLATRSATKIRQRTNVSQNNHGGILTERSIEILRHIGARRFNDFRERLQRAGDVVKRSQDG